MTRRHTDVPRMTTHFGRMKEASPSHAMTRPYTRPEIVGEATCGPMAHWEFTDNPHLMRAVADEIVIEAVVTADDLERAAQIDAVDYVRGGSLTPWPMLFGPVDIDALPLPTTPKGEGA